MLNPDFKDFTEDEPVGQTGHVSIDGHRWYAIVYDDTKVAAVVASTLDGIVIFNSMEEYEASGYA